MINKEIDIWIDYHYYWIRKAKDNDFPVYFFRYEDMITNPKEAMEEFFACILDVQNVENTVCQKLIEENLSKGREAAALDEPKVEQIENHKEFFIPKIEQFIKERALELLYFFGYTKYEEGTNIHVAQGNPFFPDGVKYYGFKTTNSELKKKMNELPIDSERPKILINDPA